MSVLGAVRIRPTRPSRTNSGLDQVPLEITVTQNNCSLSGHPSYPLYCTVCSASSAHKVTTIFANYSNTIIKRMFILTVLVCSMLISDSLNLCLSFQSVSQFLPGCFSVKANTVFPVQMLFLSTWGS